MSDVFDKATRSRIMSGVRRSRTAPEMLLADTLRRCGLRIRQEAVELPGSPDIVLDHPRIAVFVDGDFWHGRDWFERGIAPKQNRDFWIAKFEVNGKRDRLVDARLRARGWSVMRLWASEIRKNPPSAATAVRRRVLRRKRANQRRGRT